MAWSIYYDGNEIAPRYLVNGIERPGPDRSVSTSQVGGSDRAAVGPTTLEAVTVSMKIWATGLNTREEQQAAVRDIQSMFSAQEPRKLAFSDDGGLYYMAVPSGEWTPERYLNAVCVSVKLLVSEPIMYGELREVTVPSGGSVEIAVGGTYKTRPVVTAEAAVRDADDEVWSLTLDSGDYIAVATGADSACNVEVDCKARTCEVDGETAMVTLDSDWLELEPGTHAIEMDRGTGSATVSFYERWL